MDNDVCFIWKGINKKLIKKVYFYEFFTMINRIFFKVYFEKILGMVK